MEITKEFEFESSHYVPNATSHRCSHSVHGHSYKCFVTLEARKLDNAGMVYDFGLFKGTIKQFIDSMDHCHMMYKDVPQEHLNFFKENNERWIETPFIPSAEMISVFVFAAVDHIIRHTIMQNGEGGVVVKKVQIYETRTGSATCDREDYNDFWCHTWVTNYSEGVTNDWSEDLKKIMFKNQCVSNPVIEKQVPLMNFHPDHA